MWGLFFGGAVALQHTYENIESGPNFERFLFWWGNSEATPTLGSSSVLMTCHFHRA
jgi:hypothetical protein